MDNKKIEQQILEMNQKLDFITEQMQIQQEKNREFQDLKADLNIIAKDIFETAVVELEDVAPYFDSTDMIHLMKKFLRNIRSINHMFDQVEGAYDLYQDIRPLSKDIFNELMEKLNELDKKGLFQFMGELVKIVDTVITEFDVEDVAMLRESVVSILLTVKSMTQPEMLSSMNNALGFFSKMDIEVDRDVSLFDLMKKARDPEVKKGMYFMLEFVKNMAQTANNLTPKN